MTAEQAGLLATIREKPDDDSPRLVYADWLTENGFVEWAAFIRSSCQLANPDRHGLTLSQLVEVEADFHVQMRNRELFATMPGVAEMKGWLYDWQADLLAPSVVVCEFEQQDGWLSIHFRGGFIVGIRGPLDDVREFLPELLRHHLIVEAVPTDVFGDDVQDRELPRALELFIDRWVSDETMTDEAMTNMPIYFSKVLIAEAMERMERGEA